MLDECVVERARFVVVTQRTTFNEHAVNIDKIKNQHRERYETNMITLDQRPRIETLLASSRVYTTTIKMRRWAKKNTTERRAYRWWAIMMVVVARDNPCVYYQSHIVTHTYIPQIRQTQCYLFSIGVVLIPIADEQCHSRRCVNVRGMHANCHSITHHTMYQSRLHACKNQNHTA